MKRLTCLALALCLLLLSGCQGLDNWLFEHDPPPISPSPPPVVLPPPPSGPPANDLFGVSWSGGATCRPYTNASRLDALWLPLVYEGLFALDETFWPVPALCKNYTTADNKTFLFTLREGVTFHNGEPLTASDVVYSLEAARKTGSLYAARFVNAGAIRAVDERTVEMVLTAANPRLPALLTMPIVPKDSADMPIVPGTGPFVPNMEQEHPYLARFDGWWQHRPLPVGRMELVSVTSSDQLISAFETRSLSLVTFNPSDVLGVNFRGDYETWEYDTPLFEYVGFNTAKAPFSDARLRRAVAAAVDREGIGREGAHSRLTTPAALPLPPACAQYDESLAGQYGFDLSRMTSILQQLGYEDRDHDGVLEVDIGRRTKNLSLTMVVSRENDHHVAAARHVAETLTDAGVAMTLNELSFAAYQEALSKGDFDLYYGAATLSADFSPLLFFRDGSLGFGGFRDTETLALWEAAAAETTAGTAQTAFWTRFLEEAPIAPVLFQRQELLTQRGLLKSPHPVWENLFNHMDAWMVDRE